MTVAEAWRPLPDKLNTDAGAVSLVRDDDAFMFDAPLGPERLLRSLLLLPGRHLDAKDRVVGRDAPKLPARRVGADAAEELAHLPRPTLHVGAQDRFLLGIGELDANEAFASPPEGKLALAGDAQVPNPLGLPACGDEIPASLEREQIDRSTARLTGLAAANFEHARSPDAEPEPAEGGDDPVDDVAGEPARSDVALCHPDVIIRSAGCGVAASPPERFDARNDEAGGREAAGHLRRSPAVLV